MFDSPENIRQIIHDGFGSKRIIVVGDLILDHYIWAGVGRISPEAPVPVAHVQRETFTGGGAANVALNIAGLGHPVQLAGFIGADHEGKTLMTLLNEANITTGSIISLEDRGTITKTRIIGGGQQMLRLDREEAGAVNSPNLDRLEETVAETLENDVGALILSDYNKGTLPLETTRNLIRTARERDIPVIVDPKGPDFNKYSGATTVCPNRNELRTVAGLGDDELASLIEAGHSLRRDLNLDYLVVTLSEDGILLLEEGRQLRLPTVAREVFDVSGAGDTVVATLAAALSAELPPQDAIHLANLAAGVVVGKVGTSPIHQDELLAALAMEDSLDHSEKVMDVIRLKAKVASWRQQGDRLVFTNGCFDLLHKGHVTYLEEARRMGDRLVVGLNTDASVRRLKGPSRPIMEEGDRARVLAALASVDGVVLFDEDTPLNLINTLRPDILAKGADYREEDVVGASEVRSWGGEVALIPLVHGQSTSSIIDLIQQANSKTPAS